MNASIQGAHTQLLRLSILLQLEQRARDAETTEALAFIAANESFALTPYRQAIVWEGDAAGRVFAVSGVAVLDRQAPYMQWLATALPRLIESATGGANWSRNALPGDLAASAGEWWPRSILLLPLQHGGKRLGTLLLLRDDDWGAADRDVLGPLLHAYAHSWAALTAGRTNLGLALLRRLNPRTIWRRDSRRAR